MIIKFMLVVLCFVFSPFSFSATTAMPTKPSAKVNLNKVDAALLSKSVKGIGKKRAEAIVAYRTTHGPFKAIADLAAVKGLGAAFVKVHLAQWMSVLTL